MTPNQKNRKEAMVITRLKGGLGNQMFQYAAGKALAERSGKEVQLKIDLSFLNQNPVTSATFQARQYELSIFENIKEERIEYETLYENKYFKKIKSFFKQEINRYREKGCSFEPGLFQAITPVLIDGYWQSEKYFKEVERTIRHSFQFPALLPGDENLNTLQEIKTSESVAVHVRRGDYLNSQNLPLHGVCSKEYYQKAINQLVKLHQKLVFYFFSDDPIWVKEHLVHLVSEYRIVEGNKGKEAWKDMFLMSQCNHNIIANSSFSWWAAWLNKNEHKKVVAPKQWFADSNMNGDADLTNIDSWITC